MGMQPGDAIAQRGDYLLIYDGERDGLAVGHVRSPDGTDHRQQYVEAIAARGYWRPVGKVAKHGNHNQKDHGRRFASSVSPEVAAKAIRLVGENGGLSIRLTDGSEPADGYMVARDSSKFGTVVPASEFYDPDRGPAILSEHLIRNRSELGSGRAFLGAWHQKSRWLDDGTEVPLPESEQVVHLDVTDQVASRSRAVSLGRRRNQISIWDVANFDEIPTGGTGGAVAKREPGRSRLGDPQASDGDDRRRDPRVGSGGVGGDDRRHAPVVVKFAPGLRPVLKHGDPSRPGYAALHPDSQGRIGVHTGRRTDVKDQEKAERTLVHEATSYAALPESMQARIDEGLDNLGVTREQLEANVEAVYQRAISEHGDPPPGQDWYDEANAAAADISSTYGLTREQSAGMIAATSPQQAWGDNVAAVDYMAKAIRDDHEVQVDTLLSESRTKVIRNPETGKNENVTRTMYEWAAVEVGDRTMDGQTRTMPPAEELRGKRISDLDPYVAAAVMKAHAQVGYETPDGRPLTTRDDLTGRPTPVKFTCGIHHMGRAVRIAYGESPDSVLNGHKVRSFYNNIADPRNRHDDVTVDSHAFSVAMGTKYSSASDAYRYFSGTGVPGIGSPVSSKPLGVQGLYSPFADAYRAVAQRHGLTGRQMQAITWTQWRKDNPDNVRGSQLREGDTA